MINQRVRRTLKQVEEKGKVPDSMASCINAILDGDPLQKDQLKSRDEKYLYNKLQASF